jgi:hypothetical protein
MMAEKCTKTSSPLWRWMNPKPLLALNHFTVPCSLLTALLFSVEPGRVTGRTRFFELAIWCLVSEPLNRVTGRLWGSFLLAVERTTKKAASLNLATALDLQRRYTRATNAKTEYHRSTRVSSAFFCLSPWRCPAGLGASLSRDTERVGLRGRGGPRRRRNLHGRRPRRASRLH